MKVYKDLNLVPRINNPVVTIGTFDGVHLGHKQIISRLTELAQKIEGETVLLTFSPHPRQVLNPDDKSLKLLNTESEKITLLQKAGIQNLIIIPFTREFAAMSSDDFIKQILVETVHTKRLVIGYDHHFGRNREGSFEHLKQFGYLYDFEVEEIPAQDVDQVAVSSTKIRKALLEGDMATANSFLGYDYFLSGTVVKGKQLGRELGYPTANIKIAEDFKLIPTDGIYAVNVMVEDVCYDGMLSIGFNPTVNGTQKTIEVNIFNFNRDIYDERITVCFKAWIRKEEKFPDLESLKEMLHKDKLKSMELLSNEND